MSIITTAGDDPAVEALNGRWILVEGWLGGVRLPPDALARLTLRIEHGAVAFGGEEGFVSVHRGLGPAALDILTTRGPNRGRLVPAIFERAGGMLRICYDLSGANRPRYFKAPPGTRRFLATYRRAAPER